MKFSSRIHLSFCKQHTFPFETLGSGYYSLKFGYVHLIGIGGLGRRGGAREVFTTQEGNHLSFTPAQLPALIDGVSFLSSQSPSAWQIIHQPFTVSCLTPWSPGYWPQPIQRKAWDYGTLENLRGKPQMRKYFSLCLLHFSGSESASKCCKNLCSS